MNKSSWLFPFLLLIGVTTYTFLDQAQLPGDGFATFGADTAQAEVAQIIEEGEVQLGESAQTYQIARINILEGAYEGIQMEIDYGKRQARSDDYLLKPGDKIIVTISKTPDNIVNAYFVDYVRTTPILWLTLAFAAAIVLISQWKGIRALLSMAFSLYVIVGYIIPHILAGDDPLAVSVAGSIILLAVTLYLTYGWRLKTHAAVISMVLVLLITGGLAAIFTTFAKLNGSGDENVMFLMQLSETPINLRGLFLGGLIIGALGVLDDLVTTQASAVFELHHANPSLGFRGLYAAAMRIGQDHVAATVNTLVLAYAGASLPMLLMFSLARGDYGYIVNFSFIAEEIARTLVGSLGLIAAVPITTAIAIFFTQRSETLGKWEQVLGPEGGGHGHGH
ncbi:MAG: YibE/F family protein [Chloroflexi bacterium]|nr:YibE/F family protein [Chloroflexi bacterium CFX1]MCK6567771.1 YibE/F family protein [Anaerolineales bacterium]MCQ3952488.1 YibE/F family protein [Chloroflexota bacterium]MDL1919741.1 YibE/F family protein [Chloroflexi bacterium CFX5]NUQ58424.1 YibE/F family protein [Anaerolineales bacterium]